MAYEVVTKAPKESESTSHALNIMGYLHAIRRRKSLMCLGVVVGMTLGMLYYMRVPAVYESSAKILITNRNPDVLQGRDSSYNVMEDQVANQISMIRSPLLAGRAAEILLGIPSNESNTNDPANRSNLRPKAGDRATNGRSPINDQADDVAKTSPVEKSDKPPGKAASEEKSSTATGPMAGMILGGLSATRGDVRSGESSSVVMLSSRTGSPEESTKILDAVLKAHKAIMATAYRDVSKDTVALIQHMKDELYTQLLKDEEAYNKNRLDNLILTPKQGGSGSQSDKAAMTERANLQARLEALVMREAEIKAHRDALFKALWNGRSSSALLNMAERFVGASSHPNAEGPSDRLIDLISKERELTSTYGDDYQPLQKLRAQVAYLKTILPANRQPPEVGDRENAVARHIRQLNEEQATNGTLISAYQSLINKGEERLKKALTNELEAEKLQSKYQRTKELWELSSKRLQEIDLVKNMERVSTMVLAPPSDGYKVSPNRTSSVSLSAFFGILIGLGLVYLAEMTDRSFKGPDDVVNRLGAPVIAHMPAIDYKKLVSASDLEPGTTLSPVLCVHYRPKSRDAEAIRGIRTAIFFGNQANPTRLIQFTSAQAGDGKSTLACNVAISIAQSGKRVILVEADLRRPSFCNIFGKNPDVGFSQVLEGTDRWQDNLLIFPEIPNLAVLPSGQRPEHPAELLTGPLLAETLDQMKEAYDYVIIDTPPVLPVTDPCSVAARADGVILVVQMGRNTRPNAERACSLLETLGVRLLGIVMNRMTKDGGYGYGYGYGSYGYNYGGGYKYGGYAYRSNGYYARSDAYYEDDHRNGNGVDDKSSAQ